MYLKVLFYILVVFLVLNMKCEGYPLQETEVRGKEEIPSSSSLKETFKTEIRAGQKNATGGISSAMNTFQSGISTLFNASNMKESKMVVGGFSFFIIPSPDFQQLGQLSPINPGMISQLPSLPGRK